MSDKPKSLLDTAEKIGVIGSPSSTTDVTLDILAGAVNKKLVGELAVFQYQQEDSAHIALGQITEVTLRNVWHEDPTMRSLVRQRGRVDAVSERQDTHLGQMTISAVFATNGNTYKPSILGTVPATGTGIHLANDAVLNELLSPYKDQIFYLGKVYGSTPLLPLWFKHFGNGAQGAGEAYHIGIFGKTGSGKSVLAKTMLLGYSKHKELGIFILDPQGEFSVGLRNQDEPTTMGQAFCPRVLSRLSRNFMLFDLSRIQLNTWEIFSQLLIEFGFFNELGIKNSDYQRTVADYVEDFLREHKNHKLADLTDDAFLDSLQHISQNIQRVGAGQDRVRDFINEAKEKYDAKETSRVKDTWDKVKKFFKSGGDRKTPTQIVSAALARDMYGSRPVIVVDLSKMPAGIRQDVWDTKIRPLLIDRFIKALVSEAERDYQNSDNNNTLVVIDEAHRLAPSGRLENERMERIRSTLVDAVRTTRKYGLGWMFLSQTLSSLDVEIVQQLRISFFGFGLAMGSEYQKLRELAGDQKESMRLYQRFRDPHSSFDLQSREYSFMTIGPVSPLSFAGTPLFLTAFNNIDDFLKTNGLEVRK